MVVRCVEGDMKWLLHVQRGHEVVARCAEGAQKAIEWLLVVHIQYNLVYHCMCPQCPYVHPPCTLIS